MLQIITKFLKSEVMVNKIQTVQAASIFVQVTNPVFNFKNMPKLPI